MQKVTFYCKNQYKKHPFKKDDPPCINLACSVIERSREEQTSTGRTHRTAGHHAASFQIPLLPARVWRSRGNHSRQSTQPPWRTLATEHHMDTNAFSRADLVISTGSLSFNGHNRNALSDKVWFWNARHPHIWTQMPHQTSVTKTMLFVTVLGTPATRVTNIEAVCIGLIEFCEKWNLPWNLSELSNQSGTFYTAMTGYTSGRCTQFLCIHIDYTSLESIFHIMSKW